MIGYLIAYLIATHCFAEGLKQCLEHILDKRGCFTRLIGCGKRQIVGFLLLTDYRFYRKVCQDWSPTAKQQRLPEPSHSPISISKRVDELKLVVKYTADDQGVPIVFYEPVQ
ncbi:hypothetical protein SAMN02745962_04874 [Pseudomonas sp. LAIL14HWK12:I11]|nr:hypothetical protein SAMN02745962_04874 [Pseudomonas sp. LAIL14HWK12:I11]SMR79779.1 hypothetical protein SAMN05661028_04616 [Pseudomonas sp. LAIL14HWK12:I10]SOD06509.1 hypothetical protein SAMN05660296_04282 [Pseudomonas sp. LAIL14HWK12:I8]